MTAPTAYVWPRTLAKGPDALVKDWLREQQAAGTARPDLMADGELQRESTEFLGLFLAAAGVEPADTGAEPWTPVREFLGSVSRSRASGGFTPTETARFVFSLKQPGFALLQSRLKGDATLLDEIWAFSAVIDTLGLYTTEVFQVSREEVIRRQQAGDARALHAGGEALGGHPGAAADRHARQRAHAGGHGEPAAGASSTPAASVAIIDITGVPTVDTLVAQHLLKTVSAARLMGAECIISGIRPQIAQTMVHLGVELRGRGHQGVAGRRSGARLPAARPARHPHAQSRA